MSSCERYELLAEQWRASGPTEFALLEGYRLIALRCWTYSEGGKSDGISDLLRAFVRACEQAQPDGWLDAYFAERESCKTCGERYRFENVSLCTACSRTYCYRCREQRPRAPNGNPACPCGNGELVG
jgi:hypothetical protein